MAAKPGKRRLYEAGRTGAEEHPVSIRLWVFFGAKVAQITPTGDKGPRGLARAPLALALG